MAGLTRAQMGRLTQLLRDRAESRIKLDSPLARWLLADYADLCHVHKRTLRLTPEVKLRLREALSRSEGFDLLPGLPKDADRVETSGITAFDKLSDVRPDAKQVLVAASLGIPLLGADHLPSERLHIPADVSVRVPIARIDLSAFDSLLVIENLNAFDHWRDIHCDTLTEHTLVIYRGHNCTQRGVQDLLERSAFEQVDQRRIAFTDVDPAGLAIVYSSLRNITHWLSPSLRSQTLLRSKTMEFVDQHAQQTYLESRPTDGLQDIRDWILAQKIAISQERLIALKIPLFAVSLQSNRL